MVHQGLSSEARQFDPFSMPAAVSLLDQPGQPLVYVWVEDHYEGSCSVGAVQLEATQLQGEDGDAYFGMVGMGQQGLRAEAGSLSPSQCPRLSFRGLLHQGEQTRASVTTPVLLAVCRWRQVSWKVKMTKFMLGRRQRRRRNQGSDLSMLACP